MIITDINKSKTTYKERYTTNCLYKKFEHTQLLKQDILWMDYSQDNIKERTTHKKKKKKETKI